MQRKKYFLKSSDFDRHKGFTILNFKKLLKASKNKSINKNSKLSQDIFMQKRAGGGFVEKILHYTFFIRYLCISTWKWNTKNKKNCITILQRWRWVTPTTRPTTSFIFIFLNIFNYLPTSLLPTTTLSHSLMPTLFCLLFNRYSTQTGHPPDITPHIGT